MDRDVARIERCGEQLQDRLAATSVPAVDDQDHSLAMNDLGELELLKPLLNLSERRRIVSDERIALLETR